MRWQIIGLERQVVLILEDRKGGTFLITASTGWVISEFLSAIVAALDTNKVLGAKESPNAFMKAFPERF